MIAHALLATLQRLRPRKTPGDDRRRALRGFSGLTASFRSTGTRRRGACCSRCHASTPTSCISSRRPPARVRWSWGWTAASTRRRSCTSSGSARSVLVVEQNLAFRALNGSRCAERERARLVRHVGSGIAGDRSGRGRARARRCDAARGARCGRHRGRSAAPAGSVSPRCWSRSSIYPAAHQSVSQEHRGGDDPDVRERQPGRARPQRHARADAAHDAAAPFVRRGADRVHAPCRRSSRREHRAAVQRSVSAVQRRTRRCRWIRRWRLEKKDPCRRAERAEAADRVLRRSGDTRANPERDESRASNDGTRRSRRPVSRTPCAPRTRRRTWIRWTSGTRGCSGSTATSAASRAAAATAIPGPARFSAPRSGWIRRASGRSTTTGPRISPPTTRASCCCRLSTSMLAAMQKAGAVVTPPAQDIVLTRQMLLTLHETGHSLGFQHNWNSSMNGRASVMEYPTPRVKVTAKGTIDLSEAYRAEPGEYDRIMVRYAYTEFPAAKEQEGLAAIVKEMRAKGLMFTAATDPRWNWYDDLAVAGRISARDDGRAKNHPVEIRPVAASVGRSDVRPAEHAPVDGISASSVGDRCRHEIHRRAIPEHRAQRGHAEADRTGAGAAAALHTGAADGGDSAGQPRHTRSDSRQSRRRHLEGATRKTWQTITSSIICGRRGFLPGRFSSSCLRSIAPHGSWRSPIAVPMP